MLQSVTRWEGEAFLVGSLGGRLVEARGCWWGGHGRGIELGGAIAAWRPMIDLTGVTGARAATGATAAEVNPLRWVWSVILVVLDGLIE